MKRIGRLDCPGVIAIDAAKLSIELFGVDIHGSSRKVNRAL